MNIADRQLAIWLALLTFATCAYFQAGGGWNQNSQFDLTRAIVEHHTFAIDGYPNTDMAKQARARMEAIRGEPDEPPNRLEWLNSILGPKK